MSRHIPATAVTAAAAAALLVLGGSAVTGAAQASSAAPWGSCDDYFSHFTDTTGADIDLAGFAAVSEELEDLLAEYYERGRPSGERSDRLYYGALDAGVDEFEDFEDGVAREIASEQALVEEAAAELDAQEAELVDARAALQAADAAGDEDGVVAAQARIDDAEAAIASLEAEIAERTAEIDFLSSVVERRAAALAEGVAIGTEMQPRLDALLGTSTGDEYSLAFNLTREVLTHCTAEIDAALADAKAGGAAPVTPVAPVATPVPGRASFTG